MISTLLHDKIKPKDCQVLSLGDSGFLQFFRVVSSDYGKPRCLVGEFFTDSIPWYISSFLKTHHLGEYFWFTFSRHLKQASKSKINTLPETNKSINRT